MRHGWTAMDRCPGCSAGSPGGRRAMWERCNRRSNKSRSETLFLIDVAEVARPRAMIMIEQPLRRNLARSEEHTSELQSLMRNSYAVFCLIKKNATSQT